MNEETAKRISPDTIYSITSAVEPLLFKVTVKVQAFGNSMKPLIQSGEIVTVEPIEGDTEIKKGDIVIARVNGRIYLHKVRAVGHHQFQIASNRGKINGWTNREHVYGRVVSKGP